jgi:hypothetical protein
MEMRAMLASQNDPRALAANSNDGLVTVNGKHVEWAAKHFLIAASAGCDKSLDMIKQGYNGVFQGYVTKDDFAKALRSHQGAKDEMESEQRKAARKRTQFMDFFEGIGKCGSIP